MADLMTVTDSNFKSEVLESEIPVLIDFWAEWCAPCKLIAPVVAEIASEYDGKVKVAKLDVDSNPQTSMNFGIRSIPTLLIFKNGKPFETIVGAIPKQQILDKLLPLI